MVSDGEGNWYWCTWCKGAGIDPEDLPIEIVSGGARGAGMVRNIEMLKYSSHLIVFWDGESKGSKHTIENAKKYNVKLRVIGYVQELLPKKYVDLPRQTI